MDSPRRSRLVLSLLCCVAGLAAAGSAQAQPADGTTIAEEPTGGVNLPTAGISGEHDALSAVTNPAGLLFLDGAGFNLAVDRSDEAGATASGPGVGLYYGNRIGGGLLPRIGQGIALEVLRPSRVRLSPDPGTPTRFTLAYAVPFGGRASLGLGWHHFFDSDSELGGLDTFDLGLSTHLGAFLAAGLVVRDLGAPTVAMTPVERRYELELSARPTGDDRLELAVGGRLGETRTDLASGDDVDGWMRVSWRVLRGAYLRAQLDSTSLFETTTGAAGSETVARRELRLAAGLELSFGGVGATAYATTAWNDNGDSRLVGGTVVARISQKDVPGLVRPSKRIERLDLSGELDERKLTRVVTDLRRWSRDDRLAAVVVQLDGLVAGWAATDEVREGLLALRKSGVKVYAFLVAGTTRQYYLASAADKVYVDPGGGMRLYGFSSATMYFKGLFDKLGVVAQFEKIEEYKSAPEAYTRTGPTEPAFTMRNELYDSLYEHVVAGIAAGRHVSAQRVQVLIDNGPYTSGDLALIPDLVDAVVTPEGLVDEIRKDLGQLYRVGSESEERDARWDYPTVAVVYIDGDIIDGKSRVVPLLGTQLVGGDTIAESLAAARMNPDIDAVVLRINSPGGSALASEMIAREVFKLRGVKPIICSMGNVAASGGYFSAAGCDLIFADPMTITGSIGIFNGKFDLSGLFAKLGISFSTFKRGAYSDVDSYTRPYTDEERAIMKQKLHYYYGRFITAVAKGRPLDENQVDAVGRGHVWTGAQALPIKLIDREGGLADALAEAKRRVGLGERDEARLLMLPRASTSLLSQLLGPFGRSADTADAPAGLAALVALLPAGADKYLLAALPGSLWFQPAAIQARLPFAMVLGE
jgi:protease-4